MQKTTWKILFINYHFVEWFNMYMFYARFLKNLFLHKSHHDLLIFIKYMHTYIYVNCIMQIWKLMYWAREYVLGYKLNTVLWLILKNIVFSFGCCSSCLNIHRSAQWENMSLPEECEVSVSLQRQSQLMVACAGQESSRPVNLDLICKWEAMHSFAPSFIFMDSLTHIRQIVWCLGAEPYTLALEWLSQWAYYIQ